MRILLADDHTLIRETLSAFLKILDPEVEVFEAPGLKEADAIAAREPGLDLIVLDLVMPGMDGLSGVRHMVDAYPDVPVVVLSGADGRDNVTNVMNMGARGFIPKTIGSKGLISALQRVLSGNIYVPPVTLKAAPPLRRPPLRKAPRRTRSVSSRLARARSSPSSSRDIKTSTSPGR